MGTLPKPFICANGERRERLESLIPVINSELQALGRKYLRNIPEVDNLVEQAEALAKQGLRGEPFSEALNPSSPGPSCSHRISWGGCGKRTWRSYLSSLWLGLWHRLELSMSHNRRTSRTAGNDGITARGHPLPKPFICTDGIQLEHPESMISLLNAKLRLLGPENMLKVPEIRSLVKQAIKKVSLEKALHEARFSSLLKVLEHRSIILPPRSVERLQSKSFAELPSVSVALTATGVEDFVQQANI